jgi:hypothetical protein
MKRKKDSSRIYFFIVFFTVCLFSNIVSSAQQKSDEVHLKNGSVIYGTVLEVVPNDSIKIQTVDKRIASYKMDEVEKIIKSKPDASDFKKNSYVNIFDVGYIKGTGDATLEANGIKLTNTNEYNAFSIRDVNGIRTSKDVTFGLGIGYESYKSSTENFLPKTEYVPLFFDVRLHSSKNSTSGYFVLDLGYDIGLTNMLSSFIDTSASSPVTYNLEEKYKGGLFVNPAIGVLVKFESKTALGFTVGYEYQSHTVDESISNGAGFYANILVSLTSSFFTFRTSLEF